MCCDVLHPIKYKIEARCECSVCSVAMAVCQFYYRADKGSFLSVIDFIENIAVVEIYSFVLRLLHVFFLFAKFMPLVRISKPTIGGAGKDFNFMFRAVVSVQYLYLSRYVCGKCVCVCACKRKIHAFHRRPSIELLLLTLKTMNDGVFNCFLSYFL